MDMELLVTIYDYAANMGVLEEERVHNTFTVSYPAVDRLAAMMARKEAERETIRALEAAGYTREGLVMFLKSSEDPALVLVGCKLDEGTITPWDSLAFLSKLSPREEIDWGAYDYQDALEERTREKLEREREAVYDYNHRD